jgi:hypothetical protein
MSHAGKLIELRALMQQYITAPPLRHGEQFPTGLPQVDALLEGGLGKGEIVELVAQHSGSGATTLLYTILRCATERGRWAALVDGADFFDPQSAAPHVLAKLLWVRCRSAAEAVRSADLLLRDGNLPLIFLDLRGNPHAELRKIPDPTWYRLQRAIEPTPATLIALTPHPLVASAHVRLFVESQFALSALHRQREENIAGLGLRVARKRRNRTTMPDLLAEAG